MATGLGGLDGQHVGDSGADTTVHWTGSGSRSSSRATEWTVPRVNPDAEGRCWVTMMCQHEPATITECPLGLVVGSCVCVFRTHSGICTCRSTLCEPTTALSNRVSHTKKIPRRTGQVGSGLSLPVTQAL